MGNFKLLKKSKIKTFFLSNIKNVKCGAAILEPDDFTLISATIDCSLEDYEREMIIMDEILRIIPNYDAENYVEKELVISNDGITEDVVIVMIERAKIDSVINTFYEKDVKVEKIVPSFLLEYMKKENDHTELFVTMGESKLVSSVYNRNSMLHLDEIAMSHEQIANDKMTREYLVDKINSLISSDNSMASSSNNSTINNVAAIKIDSRYPELKDIIEDTNFTGDVHMSTLDEIELCKSDIIDFMPDDQKSILIKEKLKTVGKITLCCLTALEVAVYIILGRVDARILRKNNDLDEKIAMISENIRDNRDSAESIYSLDSDIAYLNSVVSKAKIKFSDITRKIEKNNKNNIKFDWLEYDKKGRLQLRGTSSNDRDVYSFEETIASSDDFMKINHDYIRKNGNLYEFQIDVDLHEVPNESATAIE